MRPPTSHEPDELTYLELGHLESARFSRRRRLLIWGGAAVALVGSLAIFVVGWRQDLKERRIIVTGAALRHGLDADLVDAVVYAESAGNPRAASRAQAYGLMQLRIPTASEMAGRPVSVDELFDPRLNLQLGCAYLRHMLDRYDGDLILALMAYNAGPGNVDRWRRAAPEASSAMLLEQYAYAQTRHYVRKVLRTARDAKAGN